MKSITQYNFRNEKELISLIVSWNDGYDVIASAGAVISGGTLPVEIEHMEEGHDPWVCPTDRQLAMRAKWVDDFHWFIYSCTMLPTRLRNEPVTSQLLTLRDHSWKESTTKARFPSISLKIKSKRMKIII